jgi:hypothetical protein
MLRLKGNLSPGNVDSSDDVVARFPRIRFGRVLAHHAVGRVDHGEAVFGCPSRHLAQSSASERGGARAWFSVATRMGTAGRRSSGDSLSPHGTAWSLSLEQLEQAVRGRGSSRRESPSHELGSDDARSIFTGHCGSEMAKKIYSVGLRTFEVTLTPVLAQTHSSWTIESVKEASHGTRNLAVPGTVRYRRRG